MGDVPTNVVAVRLRLLDVWGGEDVIRELSLAELETSERGVAVGPAFYPWRRVVSYEWDVIEAGPEEGFARPRQLLVRVLAQGPDGPEEHRVAADRFEVGPWTISMVLPDLVDTETQRTVLRRVTMPFHRVLEYERMLAEASTASAVPDRPDLTDTPRLTQHASDVEAEERVVIDVAAVERARSDENDEQAEFTDDDHAAAASTAADASTPANADLEPVAVGTDARVKKTVPRKTGSRRNRPRAS
jgi:hypothetical protein